MSSNIESIFCPRSVAVIGASRQRQSIGYQILDNLINFGFQGMVFPVNPKAQVIHSMKCYPSVKDVPSDVDLAIIVVPKQFVAGVMEECGEKGVKGAVVISAGFGETGEEGKRLERELLEITQRYGIRMVGPNCMGLINTDDSIRLNGTFAPTVSKKGNMAFISQSGALGIAILEYIDELNMGISKFVSIGNRADVSVNDLLEYLEEDEETRIILLYLESFGNPSKFTPIAKRITRKKPIIAVKAGRTVAGARAASSHTGALAGADIAVDALFEEAGVIRSTSVDELFDFALAFMTQPAPKGRRVAIVTNGGGPGILVTDACISLGLELAEFSDESISAMKEYLPAEASIGNPVDLIASANEISYERTIEILLKDENVDSLIAIFIPPIQTDPLAVAAAISKSAEGSEKPVLGVFMGREDVLEGVQRLEGRKFPVYLFPESAARALRFMAHYGEMRTRKKTAEYVDMGLEKEGIDSILGKARTERREQLDLDESMAVLDTCGISTPQSRAVADVDGAVAAANEIGYPVALKLISKELTHKSDVGGVVLGVRNEDDVRKSVSDMLERGKIALEQKGVGSIDGVLVQEMVPAGKEVVIGLKKDPLFGPLIMFGLGGIYVEVIKDVSFKLAPISKESAREMISRIRGYPILEGVRGEKGVNIDALVDILLKVSQLAGLAPDIAELDINPLIALGDGRLMALDARMSLEIVHDD